ncbi:MAG: YbaK/EbsC family protein [Pikeienuella sp.]
MVIRRCSQWRTVGRCAATFRGRISRTCYSRKKKGGLWLVSCLEDRQVRIRDLEKEIGAKGCSFGKPELLWEALGVRPGAVTPFAAMNDRAGAVRVVLDSGLRRFETLNAHPMHNAATTEIAVADLFRLLAAWDHAPVEVDFDALEALAGGRAETAR